MNQMKLLWKICCEIFEIVALYQSGPPIWPGWTPWLDQDCIEKNSALYLCIISTALFKKIAIYIKYIDKLQSGPPLDHFTAHPYGDMRPYVCIVFHECIFLPKLIEISWNYLCNQLPKVEKLKKGENSDQKAIGPLSQGRVPFKLLIQIAKGDVFEGHPGRNKCEMTEMGLENRFTWKIASKLILAVRPT